MDLYELISMNTRKLEENSYPGRGIILGLTPDEENFIQVYWIMGRSENSRNRVFIREKENVRTEAFDQEKLEDPSLIIYYPIKSINDNHIISNGDQTDTILNFLLNGKNFEEALETRKFEPDAPNYTPRISGLINLDDNKYAYRLSILKTILNNPKYCIRQFYNYETAMPGVGHCITTYFEDGNPVPSYSGEPFIVNTFNDINFTAEYYWDKLNPENKVSLLVKFINRKTKNISFKILNRNS